MAIRKGQIIYNENGHKYEVLATKHNRYNTQNLLLKDIKTNQVVIARDWRPKKGCKQTFGVWSQGSYYGTDVSYYRMKEIYKSFRKRDK